MTGCWNSGALSLPKSCCTVTWSKNRVSRSQEGVVYDPSLHRFAGCYRPFTLSRAARRKTGRRTEYIFHQRASAQGLDDPAYVRRLPVLCGKMERQNSHAVRTAEGPWIKRVLYGRGIRQHDRDAQTREVTGGIRPAR